MLKQALIAAGAIALVGCGGGDPLSEGDAQIAWEATQGAMGGAGATPSGISSLVACPEGGNVKWKYDLLGGFGAAANGGVDVEYTLVFKGCKANGIKIRGKMTYTISTLTTSDSAEVVWGYRGDLTYSGNIKGSCEYDMEASIFATNSGTTIAYEGSACGNDAYATLTANADGVTASGG